MPNAKFGIFKYGEQYKIIWYKTNDIIDLENVKDGEHTNDEKLINNIARAKSKVKEYSLCNDWEYFVTLLIDKRKQDRYNLESYQRSFKDWIKGYNRKYNADLKYITVPEQHKNGAWHEHGFFMGVNPDSLIINQNGYLDMPYYQNRFGFISLDKIRDKTRAANYITKYINKDMAARVKDVGKHLYYCSKGLQQKEYICTMNGDIPQNELEKFWQNDYCGIQWVDKVPDWINDIYSNGIIYDNKTGDIYNAKI